MSFQEDEPLTNALTQPLNITEPILQPRNSIGGLSIDTSLASNAVGLEELDRFNRSTRPSLKTDSLEADQAQLKTQDSKLSSKVYKIETVLKAAEVWKQQSGYYSDRADLNHIKLIEKAIKRNDKYYPHMPPVLGESAAEYVDRIFADSTRRSLSRVIGMEHVFWQNFCRCVLKKLNFKGLPLVTALRIVSVSVVFPDESNQKERFMNSFADEYHNQNKDMFESADIPRSLVFAVMVLNTILWSPHAKSLSNGKSKPIEMMWDMLNSYDKAAESKVSGCFVDQIYHEIKRRPIIGMNEKDVDSNLNEIFASFGTQSADQGFSKSQQASYHVEYKLYLSDGSLDIAKKDILLNLFDVCKSNDNQINSPLSEFDQESAIRRAKIQHSLSGVSNRQVQVESRKAWEPVIASKNGVIEQLKQIGFYVLPRLADIAGGHSKLQESDSGSVVKRVSRVNLRQLATIPEHEPVNDSALERAQNLTEVAKLQPTFDVSESFFDFKLYHSQFSTLYSNEMYNFTSAAVSLSLYLKSLKEMPVVEQLVTSDTTFTSQTQIVDGDHPLIGFANEPTVPHKLFTQDSLKHPLVLYHGPLLYQAKLDFRKIQLRQPMMRNWLSAYAVLTIEHQKCYMRLYDSGSLPSLFNWLLEHRNGAQSSQFPKSTYSVCLQNALAFRDFGSSLSGDVLTIVQSCKLERQEPFCMLIMSPDSIGLSRPSPVPGQKLPAPQVDDPSVMKFAQFVMQGISLSQSTQQVMFKSGQKANDSFLLSEKAHWMFHLNLASVVSQLHCDISQFVKERGQNWNSFQEVVKRFCMSQMQDRHSEALKRNSERSCIGNSETLSFKDSSELLASDLAVMEYSVKLTEILNESWAKTIQCLIQCGFDKELIQIVRYLVLVQLNESSKNVPYMLHLLVLKVQLYEYNLKVKQARQQIENLTRQLNQVELAAIALDHVKNSDTYFEPVKGGTQHHNRPMSIMSRLTKSSAVTYNPGDSMRQIQKKAPVAVDISPSITSKRSIASRLGHFVTVKSSSTKKRHRSTMPPMMPFDDKHSAVAPSMAPSSASSTFTNAFKRIGVWNSKTGKIVQETQILEAQLELARVDAEKWRLYSAHVTRIVIMLKTQLSDKL